MSKEKRRVPKLRFPGFTEDWEQRKLNEFLSVSNLKNAENKYNKKDVLSVSGDYGIVNQIDFQGRSFAGASVSNYGVVEKGDIVYTKSPLKLNPYGIIKTNRLNNGIVSTLYAIYKTKENCDSKFIEHYFNLDSRLNQYLKPLVNKGAKNDMKVSSENALIGEVCFPKITEQVLIADLLDCLDIYITLHQRKLNNLKLKKKALLQKLFPKNGERYPELRFPGFTDAWEQRKLSEVTTCFDNLRVPVTASDRVPGKIPYYGANGIQDYVSGHTHSGEFVLIAEDGANDLNDYPIQYVNGAIWVNNHAHVIAGYKEKLENKFLSYSLKTVKMTTFIVGGGRSKLNLKALLEIPISMPNYDEQCVIGKFIETIDINITLHQRKLDHLQLQKKALLQQMFV